MNTKPAFSMKGDCHTRELETRDMTIEATGSPKHDSQSLGGVRRIASQLIENLQLGVFRLL